MEVFVVSRREKAAPHRLGSVRVAAVHAADARARGEREGWVVTRVDATGVVARQRSRHVAGRVLIRFCRGVGSMLNAGVSLEDSLAFYAEGSADPALAADLRLVAARLKSGASPVQAFRTGGCFDEVFLGLVRAGSESGMLGLALRTVADRTETVLRLRARLTRATLTPVLVILFLIGVFIASQTTIVPQIEKMLRDVGQEPDAFSAVLFALSGLVRVLWPFAAFVFALGSGALIASRALRTRLTAVVEQAWPLMARMLGGFRQMLFLGTLELLVRNGVALQESLALCADVLQSMPLGAQVREAARLYASGVSLAKSLESRTTCDRVLVHLVSIGERTGTLGEQLGLLARLYEEQTTDATDAFVHVIGFATLLVAIFLIGFVFVGTYLPIVLMGPRMMQSAF